MKHPQPVVEQLLDYDYEDYNYIDDLPDKQTVIDRGNAIFFSHKKWKLKHVSIATHLKLHGWESEKS